MGMVYSIALSFISLVWVFVLLFFIMYFFTILFMNGVVDHFAEAEDRESKLSKSLARYFGTISDTLLSLFQGICGGIDWGELMDLLFEVDWMYGWTFVFYIFFMIFGVLNVVIAYFVDSASQITRKDRELATENESMKNVDYAKNLQKFFRRPTWTRPGRSAGMSSSST